VGVLKKYRLSKVKKEILNSAKTEESHLSTFGNIKTSASWRSSE